MRALTTTVLVLVAACTGPSSGPELDAAIQIPGATFYRGALPADNGGRPLGNASTVRNVVTRGRRTSVNGLAPVGTGGVLIGVVGDTGYWVVTPGQHDPVDPTQLSFNAFVDVSPVVQGASLQLAFAAVDLDGKVGPPFIVTVAIEDRETPEGTLVVSLDWDTQADLDLHVVDPTGIEVWAKNQNSYQRPAPPEIPDPNAWKAGGILDFDSNSQCVIDGRRQENVVWTQMPPSGTYTVRVDAFSLCGELAARWRLRVLSGATTLADVRGELLPSDTRFLHGAGAGVLATTFSIP